ncbi:RxLR effector protein [Phytophthora megakarya]|uniref:RxLR effector protein n=1 Tax=Phytophthora megakarya TaxID=4795 RepID=A0A225ULI5_9STRA|nr:RxLR effector protein [Phytophthora megakarya]
MRFSVVVLASAVLLLASLESAVAATNSEQTTLTAGMEDESALLIRSLAAQQYGDANKRGLRTAASDTEDDEDIGESSFLEKAKFYYWYSLKRTPAYVYKDYFEGVDRAIVVNNPAYKEWQRYERYYEDKKEE